MSNNVVSQSLLISLGSKDQYSSLLKIGGGTGGDWTIVSEAKAGDQLLLYITAPVSQIVAKAEVISTPESGKWRGNRYMADIGPFEFLKAPISLAELKQMFPNWGWHTHPSHHRVPDDVAKHLAERVELETPSLIGAEARFTGAGFGDAKTNRLVERAAIKAVTDDYRKEGYDVRSVEKENLGYDLVVTKGREEWHVEVKGVSGGDLAFPITCGEVRCAENDPLFLLVVVTYARNESKRQIREFSGVQFLNEFKREPISYFARLK